MKIALLHAHFDDQHLSKIIEEMEKLGSPKIKAVWIEAYYHYAALEGCHRLRACEILGLTPEIEEIEYSDNTLESLGLDCKDGVTISEICDGSYNSIIIDF
jgi:hypothetical protein